MNDLGTVRLETDRLILRRFVLDDAPGMFHSWATDERTTKFLSWTPHKSIDETREILTRWINGYASGSYTWVVEIKETNEIIGSIGAIHADKKNENCELGYCYASKHWNKGYGTEALKAVLAFLIKDCGFHLVEACHNSENPASGRVMEKAGMKKEAVLKERRKGSATNEWSDLILYTITRI